MQTNKGKGMINLAKRDAVCGNAEPIPAVGFRPQKYYREDTSQVPSLSEYRLDPPLYRLFRLRSLHSGQHGKEELNESGENSVRIFNWVKFGGLALLGAFLLTLPATASTVYNTDSGISFTGGTFTGTRVVDVNQIHAFGTYGNLQLSWTITAPGDNSNLYTYSYTFSGLNGTSLRPDISHFILELSQGCAAGSGCVQNATMRVGNGPVVNIPTNKLEYGTFMLAPSNPMFPANASISGIKFDLSTNGSPVTYTFQSTKAPVWGDFYIKGGSPNNQNNFGVAYNYGLTTAAKQNFMQQYNWFIARPDTLEFAAEIPEPGTVFLTGAGLLAALAWRRKQMQKRA